MNRFNKKFKRTISSLMMLMMMIITLIPLNVLAEGKAELNVEMAIDNAANWLIKNDEINEWSIMDLGRGNKEIPEVDLNQFRKEMQENKGEFKSVNDYGKYSITASALGLDATNLFGYNLIEKIYNSEDDLVQYTNTGAFALIALDSKNYDVPNDAKWTRDNIIKGLISIQNEDGGFGWQKGEASDFDSTAAVLQALSSYQDREDVKTTTEKALNYLSKNQQNDGGYVAWGESSSEAVAQVIIALTSLEIDPIVDERFVKEANLVEKLLSYQLEDGSFEHIIGSGSNGISTEQALRGLIAYNRLANKGFKFFDMKDAKLVEFPEEKPIVSFSDIDKAQDWAKDSIVKAAELGLVTGKGDNKFDPNGDITRGEFATILANLFKFENFDGEKEIFTDVKAEDWYYDAVMNAYKAGIITGKGGNKFAPKDPITREEMAVMITRALALDTVVEGEEIKDIDQAHDWAVYSIKLMSQLGIMTGDNGKFRPSEKVSREMSATIVVRITELD